MFTHARIKIKTPPSYHIATEPSFMVRCVGIVDHFEVGYCSVGCGVRPSKKHARPSLSRGVCRVGDQAAMHHSRALGGWRHVPHCRTCVLPQSTSTPSPCKILFGRRTVGKKWKNVTFHNVGLVLSAPRSQRARHSQVYMRALRWSAMVAQMYIQVSRSRGWCGCRKLTRMQFHAV